MRKRSASAVITVLAVVALRGIAACVDGVTPDCSNPAVCSPIEGEARPLPIDAAADTSTDASDAASSADAPADG